MCQSTGEGLQTVVCHLPVSSSEDNSQSRRPLAPFTRTLPIPVPNLAFVADVVCVGSILF